MKMLDRELEQSGFLNSSGKISPVDERETTETRASAMVSPLDSGLAHH